MKRRFKNSCKGFTLIEVIVAMVILGIASLLLVGMYASVCARIRSNNDFNDRMSEQQKYVETRAAGTASGLFDVHYDSSIDDGVVVATDDDDVQVDYKYFVGDNS